MMKLRRDLLAITVKRFPFTEYRFVCVCECECMCIGGAHIRREILLWNMKIKFPICLPGIERYAQILYLYHY